MNHIDAYAEYKRIVGDDDNGHLFSEEEYEEYKRKVIPLRIKNRLYVSWQNQNELDCKLIGPESMCLCQCRYKVDFTFNILKSSSKTSESSKRRSKS